MASLWEQQIVNSRSWFVHRKQLSGKRKVLIQTSWLKESSTRSPWEGEIVDIMSGLREGKDGNMSNQVGLVESQKEKLLKDTTSKGYVHLGSSKSLQG